MFEFLTRSLTDYNNTASMEKYMGYQQNHMTTSEVYLNKTLDNDMMIQCL